LEKIQKSENRKRFSPRKKQSKKKKNIKKKTQEIRERGKKVKWRVPLAVPLQHSLKQEEEMEFVEDDLGGDARKDSGWGVEGRKGRGRGRAIGRGGGGGSHGGEGWCDGDKAGSGGEED
jgi:hypothetical protein